MSSKKTSTKRVGKTPPPTNGKAESLVVRAKRILSGNVNPDDYLPVDDETIAFLDGEARRVGIQTTPESRQLFIAELTLQAHHAGEVVLTYRTLQGVIVLAVGARNVDRVSEALTPHQQSLTREECPATGIVEPHPFSRE